jgi:hypothetical protein
MAAAREEVAAYLRNKMGGSKQRSEMPPRTPDSGERRKTAKDREVVLTQPTFIVLQGHSSTRREQP